VFVDRDEVRGAESGEQFSFAKELVDGKAAFGFPDLDRDEPLHVGVGREKDFGLRSAAEASLDPISLIQDFADHLLIAFRANSRPLPRINGNAYPSELADAERPHRLRHSRCTDRMAVLAVKCDATSPNEQLLVSTSSGSLSFDDAGPSMDVLARQVDAFVAAWEGDAAPPELKPFLPEVGEIRLLTLVELIKVDLEYRWLSRGCPKRISEYFAEFPELVQDRLPCDLVYEEFHIRKQSGQEVDANEYVQAFPGHSAEIASILNIEQAYETTAFFHRAKRQLIEGIVAGDTIDDFELLAELGAGAFAKVFLARQKSMQRTLAVKISADQGTEPQTLAQLDHDHIVRVYDQRVLPDRKLRLLYMQYIAGGTLQQVIRRVREIPPTERTGEIILNAVDEGLDRRGDVRPTMSPARHWLATATWPEAVCWIGSRLARGLDYAHRRGVLHRDIKPANVLLTAEPSPKLADFNISFSTKVAGATPAAYFGGSLAYMSPEQLEACNKAHPRSAEDLDGRSDLYSLGVLLWELLTGHRPFSEENLSGSWSEILDAMVARRRKGVNVADLARIDGCPTGLATVLEGALEPDRERRWSRGLEIARRLELCTNPKASALLFPAKQSVHVRLRKFLIPIVLLLGGLPNILATAFHYTLNKSQLTTGFSEPQQLLFKNTQRTIGAIAYAVGAIVLCYLGFSVYRSLRKCQAREATTAETRALAERSVRLGLLVAIFIFAGWSIAAAVDAISLRLLHLDLSTSAMVRFFLWSLMCACVAAAYPFFGITFFALRSLYPAALQSALEGAAHDEPLLKRLGRWSTVALVAAVVAPLLSIGALIADKLIDPDLIHSDAELAMGFFCAVCLVGLLPIFWLYRSIESDLVTFCGITAPHERPTRSRSANRSGPHPVV
jgi:serine/threonine protein kinase